VGINRIKACSLLPESSLITLCILVRVGMKYMFKCIGPRRTLEELKAFNWAGHYSDNALHVFGRYLVQICQVTSCLDWIFLWFSSLCSCECQGSTLKIDQHHPLQDLYCLTIQYSPHICPL